MGIESHESFVFLYGPPASGKSAVGKRIAQELQLPFYDLDTEIELQTGLTIPEIFAAQGESGFRQYETHGLQALLARPPGVIALGGGALLDRANRRRVEAAGAAVCLTCSFETILERLGASGGGRPLLDGDARRRLLDLLEQRAQHYASFQRRVDSSQRTIAETAWEAQVLLGMFHLAGMGAGYDVRVCEHGLADLGARLKKRSLAGPVALVSDENVARLHGEAALAALRSAGFAAELIALPAGEQHKSLATVSGLLSRFLAIGLERGSTVVALGGGVVGDLTGFAAAVYLRGVRWVGLPSSLVAIVDSSLGGKTGADLPEGKNLIGAFHPPAFVLADPTLLRTLPEVELRNGLAEVVKHAVLADPLLFETCQQGLEQVKTRLDWVARRAIAVKVGVIQQDPYEQGVRATLNLGHTLGHGLELASDFRLRHGEAVAIGMVAAARLSEQMGIGEPGLARQIENCLENLGLPVRLPAGIDRERLQAAMLLDKKRRFGRLKLALPERIGAARWGVEVAGPEALIDVLD